MWRRTLAASTVQYSIWLAQGFIDGCSLSLTLLPSQADTHRLPGFVQFIYLFIYLLVGPGTETYEYCTVLLSSKQAKVYASLVGGHHGAELWRNYPCRTVTAELRFALRLIVFCTVNEFELIISSPASQPAQWPHQLDAAAAQQHNTTQIHHNSSSRLRRPPLSIPNCRVQQLHPYPLEQAKPGFLTHLGTSFVRARAPGWIARFGQFSKSRYPWSAASGSRGAKGDFLFLPAAFEAILYGIPA